MNKLVYTVSACGFLLSAFLSTGAFAEQSFIYCGKILWPSQREEYLPFPEGMEVTYSTEPTIAQAIKKLGKYTVHFSYEDMFISYKLMQGAVDMIITQGKNHVCLKAGILEVSRKGIPIEVSPTSSDGGRVVFEFSPHQTK